MARRPEAWLKHRRSWVIGFEDYLDRCTSGEIQPGLSPGGAAARLGVTRDALTQASKRGQIGAWVVTDEQGFVTIIDIPDEEIEWYQRHRRGHRGPTPADAKKEREAR